MPAPQRNGPGAPLPPATQTDPRSRRQEADRGLIASVTDWADRLIERGRAASAIPIYGSSQWHQLPDDDPAKLAAAIRAAEAWRIDGEPPVMADRLHTELEESDRLIAERMHWAHVDADLAVKPAVRELLRPGIPPRPGHRPERWVRFYEHQARRVQAQMRAAARRKAANHRRSAA